jgi:hypothetical protein
MRNRLKRGWWQIYAIVAGGLAVSFVTVHAHPSRHVGMLALAGIVAITYGLGWMWTEAHAEMLRQEGVDAIAEHESEAAAARVPVYSITFVVHAFDEEETRVRRLPSPPAELMSTTAQAESLKR